MTQFWRIVCPAICLGSLWGLLVVSTASASPWGRPQGELYLSSRSDYFRSYSDFLDTSPGRSDDLFERIESNLYTEFGLTDTVMIGGKFVYGYGRFQNQREIRSSSGVAEIEAFAQYRFWKGEHDVAAVSTTVALSSDYNTGLHSRLAQQGVDAEIRLLYGRSIPVAATNVIVAGEMGYRKRFWQAPDQLRYDALLGIELSSAILLLLQGFNTTSLGNGNRAFGYDVYRVQPSIVWHFSRKFSLQGGMIHEYAGRNIAKGNTYFLGLWSHF